MDSVLLCVGNCLMGDDGAGPLLAELCQAAPPAGWTVIDGGAAPENDIHAIRQLRPQRLVIVDATDMGLAPGETRVIDPADIADMFIMTTHNMPLSFLIDQLRADIPDITFIGIQPEVVAFYYPIGPAVQQAVKTLHQRLCHWQAHGGYSTLTVTTA
ncbi:Hydrogenase 3 maturation protease [Serratia plymuthica]|uniref:hydrogenase maturation peptidase HycI n=1 Tax=Serratia plymuthica TaxID=82996 RepID=UPI00148DDBAE|nr:hydrogenase maturation peptidase HycI [Serratia plymuthica]QJW53695.1 Hydrogenase 3 maturation protease [Serratia plymuthica]